MTSNVRVTKTHVIVELFSKLGQKYEVGYPIGEGYTEKEVIEQASVHEKLTGSFLSVKWVPGESEVPVSAEVKRLGVEAGYVSHDRGPVYEYRIHFLNSKGWSFDFKDEEEDVYSCSTIRNGWHYIDYNSGQPTVVGVK